MIVSCKASNLAITDLLICMSHWVVDRKSEPIPDPCFSQGSHSILIFKQNKVNFFQAFSRQNWISKLVVNLLNYFNCFQDDQYFVRKCESRGWRHGSFDPSVSTSWEPFRVICFKQNLHFYPKRTLCSSCWHYLHINKIYFIFKSKCNPVKGRDIYSYIVRLDLYLYVNNSKKH